MIWDGFLWITVLKMTKRNKYSRYAESYTYFVLLTLHSEVYTPRISLDNPEGETAQPNTRCSSKTLSQTLRCTLHTQHDTLYTLESTL